jgi:hypothetical protein
MAIREKDWTVGERDKDGAGGGANAVWVEAHAGPLDVSGELH